MILPNYFKEGYTDDVMKTLNYTRFESSPPL